MRTISPYVLVLPTHTERKTKSGIILGEHEMSRLTRGGMSEDSIYDYKGVVKYVPPGFEEISVGDVVMFYRYNARSCGEFVIVPLSDIFLKIEEVS